MTKITEWNESLWETLKQQLFMAGTEALEDFAGIDIPEYYEKDSIDNLLDETYDQMPEEELIAFYEKYVS